MLNKPGPVDGQDSGMAVSLSGKRSCTNPRRCQGLVHALDSRVTDVRQNPGAPRSSCWTARANAHDKCSSCPLLDIIFLPLVPFRFLSLRPYVSLPVAKMPQPGTNTKHHAIRRTRRLHLMVWNKSRGAKPPRELPDEYARIVYQDA